MIEQTGTFVPFRSIPRLSREMIVTEKIDGTNASVHVFEDGRVLAAGRNGFITPQQDNYGFAAWVQRNVDELRDGLGVGAHFGEWWGQKIQRTYGLQERRFSLFNVRRWDSELGRDALNRPACCDVVPLLSYGTTFNTNVVDHLLDRLRERGSDAAPGFMRPEGVVVFHVTSGVLFKKTLDKNDGHKSVRDA